MHEDALSPESTSPTSIRFLRSSELWKPSRIIDSPTLESGSSPFNDLSSFNDFSSFDQSLSDAIQQAKSILTSTTSTSKPKTPRPSKSIYTSSRVSTTPKSFRLRSNTQREPGVKFQIASDSHLDPSSSDSFSPYPSSPPHILSSSEADSFYHRNLRWAQRKNDVLSQQKKFNDDSETVECTFTPRTNRPTSAPVNPHAVSDRLYMDMERRSQAKMEALSREVQEIDGMYSFKPKTNQYGNVKSRYKEIEGKELKGEGHVISEFDCSSSFKPRVNTPPPDCGIVRNYLSRNAFERLYEAKTGQKSEEEMIVEPVRVRTSMTSSDFESFLDRQKNFEERKKYSLRRIELLKKGADIRQPTVCPNSKKINSQKIPTGSVAVHERLLSFKPKPVRFSSTEELTFKPKINKKSEGLTRPSLIESTNDIIKQKQIKIERAKKMQQDCENRELTFKPKIQSIGAESKLQLNVTHDYVSRLTLEQKERDAKHLRLSQLQAQNELSECTFKPKIKRVPKYIQDLASSVKKTRSVAVENVRPEWK
ncbi:hypothetical protein RCL1_002493 [Eukaryota sp. TZLM3-RCL]